MVKQGTRGPALSHGRRLVPDEAPAGPGQSGSVRPHCRVGGDRQEVRGIPAHRGGLGDSPGPPSWRE